MRKITQILVLTCFILFSCSPSQQETVKRKSEFRVLGYLFSHQNWMEAAEQIDFSKITDINLAFIHPDENGNFMDSDDITQVVKKAKEAEVDIYFSIGGGSPPEHFHYLMESEKRDHFISSIVDFAVKHDFKGVDVDIENDLINENYAVFVADLYKELQKSNKKMSAALASWNSDKIADSTIHLYDFINIMSYDQTGPWNLNRPGQHSPFSMVETDFAYFNQKRGIPAEKLLIGLPFYGYGFGDGAPSSMNYGQIVATYEGAENTNEINFPEGGTLYYNGKNLIAQKVKFALDNKTGGVMIWQLRGDSEGPHSLLDVINNSIKSAE